MRNNPKKELIIKAAQRRFVRHGLKKTSIEEIARDLRIGKASIYHYFNSKEDIFKAVIFREIDIYIENIINICNNEELTVKEKLNNYIEIKISIKEKNYLLHDILASVYTGNLFKYEIELVNHLIDSEVKTLNTFLKNNIEKKQTSTKIAEFLVHQSWSFYFVNQLNESLLIADNQKKYKEILVNYISETLILV